MLFGADVGDERAAFGHPVPHCQGELYLFKKLLHFTAQSRAADHDLEDIASEHAHQFLADFSKNRLADHRHLEKSFDRPLLQLGLDLFFINLLQNKRYGKNCPRPDLSESGDQHLGRRNLPQKGDMTAYYEREEEVKSAAVAMSDRQKGEDAVPLPQREILSGEFDIAHQAVPGKASPLWKNRWFPKCRQWPPAHCFLWKRP